MKFYMALTFTDHDYSSQLALLQLSSYARDM
uniref:Uncharacterized protein n=1 Tax=Anguilla anguilla TaxID=7936 RepID=A0A0E9QHM1_ANGAN